MKPNPIMWVASTHSSHISHRKVAATDRRYPRATFHDTWEEAHAAVLARANERLERAGRDAQQAVRWALNAAKAVSKVEAMTKPGEAA